MCGSTKILILQICMKMRSRNRRPARIPHKWSNVFHLIGALIGTGLCPFAQSFPVAPRCSAADRASGALEGPHGSCPALEAPGEAAAGSLPGEIGWIGWCGSLYAGMGGSLDVHCLAVLLVQSGQVLVGPGAVLKMMRRY